MNAAATMIALALTTPAAPQPPAQGGPDVKETIERGLKWLAAKQKSDGSWEGINGLSPTLITSSAGLALLMEGSTPQSGVYAEQIRKTIAWFEKNAKGDGLIKSESESERFQPVTVHAHALLFLACAYEADDEAARRQRIDRILRKAVQFAVECQTNRGGWGFVKPSAANEYDEGMNTATVLQALLAARKAGIEVPKSAIDRAFKYLVNSTNRDGDVIYSIANGAMPMGGDGQPIITAAAAAAALTYDGGRPAPLARWVPRARAGAAQQMQLLRSGGYTAMLSHYHVARVAFALGENGHRKLDPKMPDAELVRWSAYRAELYTAIQGVQGKDGQWADPYSGPVYGTALALVILQLDNDYLPAFSR